jgi:hypothetical protein
MWDLVINQHLASSFVLSDLTVKVLKWINHKTIPLIVSCFVYHWIWFKCECITTDRLQNNTVESALRVLRWIDFEMIPLNLCWRYYNGSITKQYLSNLCIHMMTHKYEWIASCSICYSECDSKKKVLYWIDSKTIPSEYVFFFNDMCI